MTSTTATVETLTAEVRVLMLGNRQVTLSLFQQLDVIPVSRLEAFGRVHATKPRRISERERWSGNWEPAPIELVGRDKETGVLSCAHVPRGDYDDAAERLVRWAEDLPLIVLAGLR